MARARNQSAITDAIDKMFVDEKIFTEEELAEAVKMAGGARREEIEGQLDAAVGHIQSLLDLIAGFNANHDPMQGWCRFCDGNYLHSSEACACVCHPAREFVKRMRDA